MRQLFRGRSRRFGRVAGVLAVAAATLCSAAIVSAARSGDGVPFSVRITSPLGRSGVPGRVRVVARITTTSDEVPPTVRFYVNGALIGTDVDGPPYSAEWEDENPFERCRLTVEADDPTGGVARDEIELDPLEVVETSSINSVGLDATVQDARGRYVRGLDMSQFQLSEDGEPQTIDLVTSAAPPTVFALLIDSSQSMSVNINMVRRAAGRLADFLREEDSVVIAPFRNGITSVTGPTRDRTTISEAVAAITPKGGTAIIDALLQAGERFPDTEGRRVVVLITDGYDEQSQQSFDAALERLKGSQVTVYVVAIGGVAGVSLKGEGLLRRIANETGGRAFFPWNDKELSAAHTAIAEDVQHRYRLVYTPTNQRQDSTWRTITLTTTEPTDRVRARPGYQALTAPPVRASIEFTAFDNAYSYVDLARDDIEVLEDGAPQTVDVFQEAVAPVTIVLALDQSGSMTRSAPAVREAAGAFIDALRPKDPLGLVLFADRAELVTDLGTARDTQHEAIASYRPRGGTALYDALELAMGRLKSIEGRRVIVVVSDGRDEDAASKGPGSATTWEEVVANARAIEASIYAIGLGSRVDRPRLEELARVTGGEAYFTTDVATLERHYRRVVEELHRRYVVEYTSTNLKRDGGWRNVELRSRAKGVHVRSRGGYHAPPQ